MFGQKPPFGAAGGFGTPGFGTGFGAQPAQPAFGATPSTGFGTATGFGAAPAAAPAANPFGGTTGGFGATAPAFGAAPAPVFGGAAAPALSGGFGFGQAAQPAATGFGATTTGGFGATSTFGAPAAPAAGGFPFGTPSTGATGAFGAKPAAGFGTAGTAGFGATTTTGFGTTTSTFGAPAASPFGTTTTPGFGTGTTTGTTPFAFGQTAGQAASPFGGATTATTGFGTPSGFTSTAQQSGTLGLKFQQITENESGGSVRHNSITAMPQYENKSFEELRFEDYQNRARGGAAPSAGGMFGATTAAPGFGQTTTPLFGATTTPASPFGATAAPAASAFGAPAFGAAATTPSTQTPGLFGAQPSTAPAFAGFGTTSTAPAFGAPPTATSTFTGFGTAMGATSAPTATNPFGTSTFGTGTTPFGTPGATTGTGTTPFAFGAGTTGQTTSLFGTQTAKPAAFMPTTTTGSSLFPGLTTGGIGGTSSLFPTTGASTQSPFQFNPGAGTTSTTGTSNLFPGLATGTGIGGLTFPSTTATSTTASPFSFAAPGTGLGMQPQQQQQQPLVAKIEQPFQLTIPSMSPKPAAPTAAGAPQQAGATGATTPAQAASAASAAAAAARKKTPLLAPQLYKMTPKSAAKIKPRTYGGALKPNIFDQDSTTASGPASLLSPDMFVSRQNVKKLVIDPADDLSVPSPAPQTVAAAPVAAPAAATRVVAKKLNIEPEDYYSPAGRAPLSPSSPSENVTLVTPTLKKPLPTHLKLTRPGYATEPPMERLRSMTPEQLAAVRNFSVRCENIGSVTWLGDTDVRGLNLDELVTFSSNPKEVVVYPDDRLKPPVGQALNKPALVSLLRVFPLDKATKEPVTDPVRLAAYAERLRERTAQMGARFVSYDQNTGEWVFRVEHFSRYGLAPGDDEDEPGAAGAAGGAAAALPGAPGKAVAHAGVKPAAAPASASATQATAPTPSAPSRAPVQDLAFDEAEEEDEHAYDIRRPAAYSAAPQSPNRFTLEEEDEFAPPVPDDEEEPEPEEEPSFGDDDAGPRRRRRTSTGTYEPAEEPTPARPAFLPRQLGLNPAKMHLMKSVLFGAEPTMPSAFGPLMTLDSPAPSPQSAPPLTAASTSKAVLPEAAPSRDALLLRRLDVAAPLEQSSLHARTASVADAGLFLGRSFRAGWGPRGLLVLPAAPTTVGGRVGFVFGTLTIARVQVQHNSSTTSSSENAAQQRPAVSVLLPPSATSPVKAPLDPALKQHVAHLEEHFKHSTLKALANGAPSMSLTDVQNYIKQNLSVSDHLLARGVELGASERSLSHRRLLHNSHVWRLVRALWADECGFRDDESRWLGADERTADVAGYRERLARRKAFSEWLQHVVAPRVRAEAGSAATPNQQVFALLTGRLVKEAVDACLAQRDVRLGTLLAQATTDAIRPLLRQQLESWQQAGCNPHLAEDRMRVMRLLAGHVSHESVLSSLEWHRQLALHLWYGPQANASLCDAINTYERTFRRGRSAAPLPTYAARASISGEVAADAFVFFDTLFHLMKLYEQRSYALWRVVDPKYYTPFELDYSLSFQLATLFAALPRFPPQRSLHAVLMNYAGQLEVLGLWHWGLYVILHIPDPQPAGTSHLKEQAIRALLARNVFSATPEQQRFVLERIKVPLTWWHEAKSWVARNEHDVEAELEHCRLSQQWQRVHELVLPFIAPQAFLQYREADLVRVTELLQQLSEHLEAMKQWRLGGGIYHDYINTRTQYIEFMDQYTTQASSSPADLFARAEQLHKDALALCQRLKEAASQLRVTIQQRVCFAELSFQLSEMCMELGQILFEDNETELQKQSTYLQSLRAFPESYTLNQRSLRGEVIG